jgi:hypothetical protein
MFSRAIGYACLVTLTAGFAACGGATGQEESSPTQGDAGAKQDGGADGAIFDPEDAKGTDASGGDTGSPSDTGSAVDTAVEPDTAPPVPNIWNFNGYCGGSTGATCPSTYPPCATFPTGVAGQVCAVAFERCVQPGTGSIATKIFDCLPTKRSVWAVNAVCAVAGCTPGAFPDCPAAGPSGVAGQDCAKVGDRCLAFDKVFVCLPGSQRVWAFNGNCSLASMPFSYLPACEGGGFTACTSTSVAGSPCSTEFDRCLSTNKIFACVQR